jgi:hypothetical protein
VNQSPRTGGLAALAGTNSLWFWQTESVWADCSLQESQLDEQPQVQDGQKPDEKEPSGSIPVMAPLYRDGNGEIRCQQKEGPRQKADGGVTIKRSHPTKRSTCEGQSVTP